MKKKIGNAAIGFMFMFATLILVRSAIAINVNDASEIKTLVKGYESVLNASDVNGILKLYAKDGVFMPQHSPTHVGLDAIRAAYEQVFEAIDLDVKFDIGLLRGQLLPGLLRLMLMEQRFRKLTRNCSCLGSKLMANGR